MARDVELSPEGLRAIGGGPLDSPSGSPLGDGGVAADAGGVSALGGSSVDADRLGAVPLRSRQTNRTP